MGGGGGALASYWCVQNLRCGLTFDLLSSIYFCVEISTDTRPCTKIHKLTQGPIHSCIKLRSNHAA